MVVAAMAQYGAEPQRQCVALQGNGEAEHGPFVPWQGAVATGKGNAQQGSGVVKLSCGTELLSYGCGAS